MPVEIKELHIRVTVDTTAGNQMPQQAAPASVEHLPQTEAIVAECVEQVMQILKEKTER